MVSLFSLVFLCTRVMQVFYGVFAQGEQQDFEGTISREGIFTEGVSGRVEEKE